MINPSDIVDNLVTLLRAIPELVIEVGDNPERIFAYHDRYPQKSLQMARYQMPAPSIMVAWEGSGPGSFGGFEAWQHDISVSLRIGQEPEKETPHGYYRLFRLITKGVPSSGTQPLQYTVVHDSCHPMNTPAMRRQTDIEGVDYFEVTLSFTEKGDD
ncbi:MAG: hypothetical protein JW730_18195 [Anaerolineales bacterium]|nr:hypothetical protein [Anaerolineales bacterium]